MMSPTRTCHGGPDRHTVTVDGRPLRHIVLHSPTGFPFGYCGSSPADLSPSLLARSGFAVVSRAATRSTSSSSVMSWPASAMSGC